MDYCTSLRRVIASGDGPKERGISQDKLCSRRIGLTTLLDRYGSINRGVRVSARKRTVRFHVESMCLYHAVEDTEVNQNGVNIEQYDSISTLAVT